MNQEQQKYPQETKQNRKYFSLSAVISNQEHTQISFDLEVDQPTLFLTFEYSHSLMCQSRQPFVHDITLTPIEANPPGNLFLDTPTSTSYRVMCALQPIGAKYPVNMIKQAIFLFTHSNSDSVWCDFWITFNGSTYGSGFISRYFYDCLFQNRTSVVANNSILQITHIN